MNIVSEGINYTGSFSKLIYLDNNKLLAGNTNGHIYKSSDFGTTWRNTESDNYSLRITTLEYLENGIVLAGACNEKLNNGHIYRSVNSGSYWTDLGKFSNFHIPTFSYIGSGSVIATSYEGYILKSQDYGATWTSRTRINNNINSSEYLVNGIMLLCDSNGYLLRSKDYGNNWDQQSFPGYVLRDLSYISGSIVIMTTINTTGQGEIRRSIDLGENWASENILKSDFHFEAIANNIVMDGRILISNNNGNIISSSNAGISWSNLHLNLSGDATSMVFNQFSGSINVVAGTVDGYIYQNI